MGGLAREPGEIIGQSGMLGRVELTGITQSLSTTVDSSAEHGMNQPLK